MDRHIGPFGNCCQETHRAHRSVSGTIRHVATRTNGERLGILLDLRGMKAADLAKALDVNRSTVTNWLKETRSADGFGKLVFEMAEILQCDAVWLNKDGEYIRKETKEKAPPIIESDNVWRRVAYRMAAHPRRWKRAQLDQFSHAEPSHYKGTDAELDRLLDGHGAIDVITLGDEVATGLPAKMEFSSPHGLAGRSGKTGVGPKKKGSNRT